MGNARAGRGRRVRLAVVGNPDNRRVRLFAEAALAAGFAEPRVVPWLDVLRDGGADFASDEVVRLDSPGEHPGVDRLLRDTDDPTRVEGGARWYARFTAAVRTLRGGVRLDDPGELAVLFDKRRCHQVLARAGVPVPDSPTSGGAAPMHGWADLRALMRSHRMPRAFVKPAHGSSASGVIALETAGGGRLRATTSVECVDGRLFNSLRVRRITAETEVAALVDALAPDGLHLERWLPKATVGRRTADLRVVVVAGRATHAVVRTSRWPMTNLHLGGARGDLSAVMAVAGPAWAEALDVCERAAACFPGTLAVGVDLLPVTGWQRFAVAEVNAFGDLLPRLTGLPGTPAEGLDTYRTQLAALAGHLATPRADRTTTEHRATL
ncbi:Glutathione synthase/RimK-type ligase, ATP-grasp superfamily [Actinacidiphila rubida]|uniref:Glutathione synthase/RimK-type ligase, ATP-grasp superfamily n=1 Tax=Actinacidiphila rubida TaxID=310780 RepID=A0A1H8EED3_9ACTN|nr:STM4014 family protein [Actinacidiphila rubida]SEN17872.1 Glutathione synthase/RimK-type ligase, ATP-grasp superfamily [Actinacidiphila rubida]